MNELYVERRHVSHKAELGFDIARHLMTRFMAGPVVVVSSKPFSFLSPLRKNWINLTRSILVDRARSLEADKIRNYSYILNQLQNLNFSAQRPNQKDGVVILSPEDSILRSGDATLYLTCEIPKDNLDIILDNLNQNSVIIDYKNHM